MNFPRIVILIAVWCVNLCAATGDLAAYIDSYVSGLPGIGTNAYHTPSAAALATWGRAVSDILAGNYSTAQLRADSISYKVTQYYDNGAAPNRTYYLLERKSGSTNYWGMFIYNPSSTRTKLFIQSSHPRYDSNTGAQGFMIFKNVNARAFIISGTHRCNATDSSDCDGTTTACDGGSKYKISDQAHNVNATFQRTTEILAQAIPNLVVIQNHGFGKDTGDPDVIMSNGTRLTPTNDYLLSLRDNLASIDPTLTFKVVHVDLTWTKLLATENTQGRYLNGSGDPCFTGASACSGSFLHVEQAYTGLRDNATNRKKLSDAIAMTFATDGLTLTAPNGNQTITGGSSFTITWTSTGIVGNVRIEYTTDNGSKWNTITASTANSGTYSWTVPTIGTWRAKVRIYDAAYSSIGDTSNAAFKINYAVYPTTGAASFVDAASAFGPRLLSGVYDFHRGMDFPGTYNIPIRPALPGVIVRKEDSTVTIGTALERNGNWLLVKIDSAAGQPRHNAYLHLNGFSRFNVGDTVTTADTIGYMGKSGVGINTIHTHLELYKNLSGTSIDKDKAKNPVEILPYTNANNYEITFLTSNDSTAVQVKTTDTELDVDAITIYGSITSRTVGFNARTGIDPSNNDNPAYNNVLIDPDQFLIDSSYQRIRFWTKNSEIGTIDSAMVSDVNGYSITVYRSEFSLRYAVSTGNFDGAIWALTSGGVAGSATTPTSYNDIIVNANVTVTINSPSVECKSVSFGATTSKFSFNANSMLSVYGDFTLASTSHNAISAWGSGAKIRFAGSAATQTISGFSTTGFSTSLNDVLIDKPSGKVTTAGNGMRFSFGNSFTIADGTFELDTLDDIETRDISGNAVAGTFLIQPGCVFKIIGGDSYIRRGANTDTITSRTGKMTIYGEADLCTQSTTRLNFGGIDVESGGLLVLTTGWTGASNCFNAYMVTIKSGGLLTNQTTQTLWHTTSSLTIQSGGKLYVSSSSVGLPNQIFVQGDVEYYRTSAQTISNKITAYKNLIFSGSSTRTLSVNTAVNGTLTMSGTASLSLGGYTLSYGSNGALKYASTDGAQTTTSSEFPSSGGPKQLIVDNTSGVTLHAARTLDQLLYLSQGTLNNSSAVVTMNSGSSIKRSNSGQMSAVPTFTGTVNIEYVNQSATLTAGNELPSSTSALNNLTLSGAYDVSLNHDATINGQLTLGSRKITTGTYTLYFGSSAVNPNESGTSYISGKAAMNARSIGTDTMTFLGARLSGAGNIGSLSINRTLGSSDSGSANHGINSFWTLTSSAGEDVTNKDISLSWYSNFDNSRLFSDTNRAAVWLSTNSGSSWKIIPPYQFQSASGIRTVSFPFTNSGRYTVSDSLHPLVPTLNGVVLLQGFWDGTKTVCDTLTAEMRSSTSPYAVIESSKGYSDSLGNVIFHFSTIQNGTQYYLAVKHRNSITTWSNVTFSYVNGCKGYNFTIDQNSAYGANLGWKDGRWCIFAGDVNQDGFVDFSDLGLIDTDSYNYATGYLPTDLNGDGYVDFSDLALCDNSSYNYVSAASPSEK